VIVVTSRLFLRLLRALWINTVCDVGSCDGAAALWCRAVLANARIVAFEPNPGNQHLMQADPALARARIELQPAAGADIDGMADLFVVPSDYSAGDLGRALSSLYRRPAPFEPQTPTPVAVTRLDTFFAEHAADLRLALWIDVEGKAYEVITGTGALSEHVLVIHVELETRPAIAPGQRLYPEVRALLEARGFQEVATSVAHHHEQLDAVFVRRDLSWPERVRVRACVVLARARFLAKASGLYRIYAARRNRPPRGA
jgi:FkbM family methyltransferase